MNRRELLCAGSASVIALAVGGSVSAALSATPDHPKLRLVNKALEIADSYGFNVAEKAGMFGLDPQYIDSVDAIKNFAHAHLPRDLFARAEYMIGIEDKRRAGADRIALVPLDEPHPNLSWKSLREVLANGTYFDVWHAAAVYGCDVHGDLD